ncbi:MAG: hypothetical protein JXB38_02730, partial [Anaerolineales bacterium]|nr:hypothetical protein [Anaerolineales bacterium]
MPDFAQSLQAQDLEHLRAMIELWGVEVAAPDVKTAIRNLFEAVLDEELVAEVCAALPEESRVALAAVQSAGGRLPWSQFARRFGEVREMGP